MKVSPDIPRRRNRCTSEEVLCSVEKKETRSFRYYRKNADCDTPLAVLQSLDSYDLSDFLAAQGVRSEVARHRYAHADEIMAG
jgi:hypothetical protein